MMAPFGSFDSSEVSLLQTAFDFVCAELGIGASDENRRALIAGTMISHAKAGQFDADRLKSHAITKFKMLAAQPMA
jgi:hypothetical protein